MPLLFNNQSKACLDWVQELKEFQLDDLFDTNVLGKAYLYLNKVKVQEKRQDSIYAIVGEKGYEVRIHQQDKSIYGQCSYPYEGNCKHLAATLLSFMDIKM